MAGNVAGIISELIAIRARIRKNVPRSNKPEAFHEEKSEIAADITAVIEELGRLQV